MFDFEKLTVYLKAKSYNLEFSKLLKQFAFDSAIKNQLRRSSLSIALNIAEGSGRKTNADKRNFFIIARGSVFECVAIFDILKDEGIISKEIFQKLYCQLEELSKMLYAMTESLIVKKS
ncbi:MAG: four helix bundle protein [Sporocytophaga sp.]|uniref:four helix bundle protein n=1 Tax=Sporocytophaga sp. TaxID=2231183 RepID=UPI001B2A041C|nr:four helix bundle protein [Sporocytophaga sp.]MBO9699098.1 four helix bundle protein [Sporocytophaga sp.]